MIKSRIAVAEQDMIKQSVENKAVIHEMRFTLEQYQQRISKSEMLYEKLNRGQNNLLRSYENVFDENSDFQNRLQDEVSEVKHYVNNRLQKFTQQSKDQDYELERQKQVLDESMKKFDENLKHLNQLKIRSKKLEQMMEHLSINTTRKEYTQKHNKIFKTQLDAMTYKHNQLKTQLLLTDIYIDRYFPIRMVNLIHDVGQGAFGEYNDNKKFLENVDRKFKWLNEKLRTEEQYDKELGNKENQKKCNLVKNSYEIPPI